MMKQKEIPDLSDKNKIINEYNKDIEGKAEEYAGKGLTKEQLLQCGRIGVFKAIESYDSSKGTAFRTHIINMIEYSIFDEFKAFAKTTKLPDSMKNQYQRESLEIFEQTKKLQIYVSYSYIEETIERKLEYKILYGALNKLKPEQREVIKRFYGLSNYNEQNLSEIAKDLGYSESKVRRLKDSALFNLANLIR